jgi:putative hydrolase of the HAD superfamily
MKVDIMKNHIDTVLFDLGNTLVGYYTREEFPAILGQAISEVAECLESHSLLTVSLESALAAAPGENYEGKDHVVHSLIGRLCRIFELNRMVVSSDLEIELCQRFLKPVFGVGHLYDDTLPVLTHLRSAGYRSAIISNTPWGSPASLWREEINRWELGNLVDIAVFCEEVGVRKPAREIFEYTLDKLGSSPDRCVFVGDDPRWDIAGPQAIGMAAVLIDRDRTAPGASSIRGLCELLDYLGVSR